jgi:nascent polypeptide-associated complex subunit alpha
VEANNNANETDELDETGIPADSIKMVMEHCKCDRKAAVKALRHSNGDTVNAIMQLSE